MGSCCDDVPLVTMHNATPQQAAAAVQAMVLVHSADLSPDGNQVAWSTSYIVGDDELIELRIGSRAGGLARLVTWSPRDRSPAWAPDGRAVAFLSTIEGATSISLVDPVTLACRALVDGSSSDFKIIGPPVWSPDGRRLAFTAVVPRRKAGDPYRVTRVVGWVDGLGLVDDMAADVFVVAVATGDVTRLTADDWFNRSPCWTCNGEAVVYIASWSPETWESVAVVRAVSLEGVVRDLVTGTAFLAVTTLEDGAVVASTPGPQPNGLGRLLVIHSESVVDDRSSALELDVNGDIIGDVAIPFVDPDPRLLLHDGHAIVRVQIGDRLEVHRVTLQGPLANEVLLPGDGCLYPLAVSGSLLLHGHGSLTSPPDLYVRDLAMGQDTRITHTAAHNHTVLTPVVAEQFWINAAGGPPIDCKFLRPAHASAPLPTVLLIHGGPKSAFGEVFFGDAQVLCEAGFGVLMANPRGSRGYGPDFLNAITGDWGNRDFADLMAAVDKAVTLNLADPDRLGVSGLSYGGYMSSWIIGHTDRFSAAVIENPVSNFWSMYGTSDVGMRFLPEVILGTPATNFDEYVRMSPLTYVGQVRTPSLLILGEQDHRCPPEQGKQFYSALRRVGCDAELLMLPGESHGGSVDGAVISRRAQNEASSGASELVPVQASRMTE
jgi:dipeptidyl aminopeptidase/acylaminoacyl peptidase